MNSRRWLTCAFVATALLCGGAAFAAEQLGTAEEARAMLDRAIAALKANEAAALAQFNDQKNKEFRDRDLSIFCFGLPDGKFTAYESDFLLGANIRELKLPPNDPVGQRAYDAVANAPEGDVVTVGFDLPKPGTKKPVPKESIEVRIGKQACGVSYFK